MTTRHESLRDQIATAIQVGHIERKTSDETASCVMLLVAGVVNQLEQTIATRDETIELMALGTCRDTP